MRQPIAWSPLLWKQLTVSIVDLTGPKAFHWWHLTDQKLLLIEPTAKKPKLLHFAYKV